MKTVGLITEYNPFHLGHKYHIEQARAITGANSALVIMSGNYVQRGTPAFLDKHTRAHIALKNGADIVFELPVPFSNASAEYFSYAAVRLLDKMKVVDCLCFGSETDDIEKLKHISDTLADAKTNNSHPLNQLIRQFIATGVNFPSARANALITLLKDDIKDINSVINMPNNILAIEYMKALKLLKSPIKPFILKRKNAAYHCVSDNMTTYSASSLRNYVEINNCPGELSEIDSLYESLYNKNYPVQKDSFSSILFYKLMSCAMSGISFDTYQGIDPDFSNRLAKLINANRYRTWTELSFALKSKNLTLSSVNRALLCIINDTTKAEFEKYINNDICSYIRILGIKKDHFSIIKDIKAHQGITPIGQLTEWESLKKSDPLLFSESDNLIFNKNIYCDELYYNMLKVIHGTTIPSDYRRRLLIL